MSRILHRICIVFVISLAITATGLVAADDTDSDARIEQALRITTDAAKMYSIELLGEDRSKLQMIPESLLRWSNSVVGEIYGNVFVWTDGHRPQVVGSFHQWYSPHTHGSHEFHSLASAPLRATREGIRVWSTEEPGLTMKTLPDAPAVAATPTARLSQLRRLARRFTVTTTNREGVTRDMRLLSQPLYRYQPDDDTLVDGAMFAFVQGTDPEAFLLIDAVGKPGQSRWRFGLTRMNSVKIVAQDQNRIVWQVDVLPWSEAKDPSLPFTLLGPFEP